MHLRASDWTVAAENERTANANWEAEAAAADLYRCHIELGSALHLIDDLNHSGYSQCRGDAASGAIRKIRAGPVALVLLSRDMSRRKLMTKV